MILSLFFSYIDVIVCFAVEGDGVAEADSNAGAVGLEIRLSSVPRILPKRVQHRVV